MGKATPSATAWERGQDLAVHGWVYSLKDGLVRQLGLMLSTSHDLAEALKKNWEKSTAALYQG